MLLYAGPDRSTASRGDEEVSRGPIPQEGAAMIKQAEKSYAPLEVERQVQEFWSRTKAYQKTVAAREKGEDFYFGDGPPFTTGSIHLGQVLNKTIKDLVVRYHRMPKPGTPMKQIPRSTSSSGSPASRTNPCSSGRRPRGLFPRTSRSPFTRTSNMRRSRFPTGRSRNTSGSWRARCPTSWPAGASRNIPSSRRKREATWSGSHTFIPSARSSRTRKP